MARIVRVDKRKLNKLAKKIVNAGNVKIAILAIPIIVEVVRRHEKIDGLSDLFDSRILVSFLVAFICEEIASAILRSVGRRTEDATKLTEDYSTLVKKYRRCNDDMPLYEGKNGKVIFPMLILAMRKLSDESFNISTTCNSDKHYELPHQISMYSREFSDAHKYSNVYNNLNIRLDDLITNGKSIELKYSYTTYFDSLITNKAMDYPFLDGKSVREIYEPGPWMSSLSESKLSNHIGFNGFVELSDGKVVFVYRRDSVSVAKRTWAEGVSASLKAVYALDDGKKLSAKGISDAIRQEIFDELKIEIPKNVDLCKGIFAFYRDILEGGKPQFVFYYKVDSMDEKEFVRNFKKKIGKKEAKKEDKEKLTVDGTTFRCITVKELREAKIEIDGITLSKHKKMKMTAGAVATLAMFLNAYQSEKI